MTLGFGRENNRFFSWRLFAVTLATSGALSWFFVLTLNFEFLFQNVTNERFWIFLGEVLFYGAAAFSALVGGHISEKVSRRTLLLSSITLGVLATGSLALLHGTPFSVLLGTLLGISFGFGFPSGAALFADRTEIGERGKFAGILIFTTFILISLEMGIAQVFGFGLIGVVVLTALLRGTSYFAIALDPCDKRKEKERSYVNIFARRDFGLYLLPWVLFNLVAGLANFIYPSLPNTPEFNQALEIGNLLQFLGVATVSLLSGYISDRFGRRPPIVVGVVLFGVSFAIFGLATSPLSLIIQLTTHGIAWGFCMVAYFAIPGDLSHTFSQEKFYAIITVLPFVSYMATGTMPLILGVSSPANVLSPILSVLLFLSVVPVLYAPETLPETNLKARKLKEHIRKVGKVIVESKKAQ